ncbi:hypothetical protein SADUNF_Sadunf04G0108500 [Salix dunnii]|uniref:DUF7086 domain-containing protein n=1 Tax=Salix dunnii TaxID=1413687 RepID=A0A835KBS9_9ROSI|nr:hypothetical protein SADUNF_Sadunf04G0108500 [Salix dunnii]
MTLSSVDPFWLSTSHALLIDDIPLTEPLLYITASINQKVPWVVHLALYANAKTLLRVLAKGKGKMFPSCTLGPWIEACEKQYEIGFDLEVKFVEIGCCTLDQLKYFCKHTKNHRIGAKDRVLFLAYLGLCKQLNPNGPFDH